jgi:hypothetical protein
MSMTDSAQPATSWQALHDQLLLSSRVLRYFQLDRFGTLKSALLSMLGGIVLFVAMIFLAAGAISSML